MAKRTAKANGKYARRKGLNFERWIVNEIKHIFPKARRQLESQEGMGFDIENSGPFRIQAKCYANYAPINKINEVPDVKGTIPVLITKGTRLKPMVVMPMDEWIKMVEALYPVEVIDESTDEQQEFYFIRSEEPPCRR